jgi:AraC-like DNA-binding protein
MVGKLIAITDWKERARRAGHDPTKLAQSCKVSLRRLEQQFREQFHDSPTHCLLQWRLAPAVELMSQGLSVKETAFRLGFADASAFCHAFRRVFGCTPRQALRAMWVISPRISFSDNEISLWNNFVSFSDNEYSVTGSASFDNRQSNTQTQAYENIRGNRPSSDRRHYPGPAIRPPSRRQGAQFQNVGLGI